MAAATQNLLAPSGLAGALTAWSILSANFSLVTDNWCDKPAAFMRSRVWSSDCLMWHELSQRTHPELAVFLNPVAQNKKPSEEGFLFFNRS
jgi:hypothetical protein